MPPQDATSRLRAGATFVSPSLSLAGEHPGPCADWEKKHVVGSSQRAWSPGGGGVEEDEEEATFNGSLWEVADKGQVQMNMVCLNGRGLACPEARPAIGSNKSFRAGEGPQRPGIFSAGAGSVFCVRV